LPLAALIAILAIGAAIYLAGRLGLLAALGGIVDRSVAMWLFRRLTGRPDPLDAPDGDEGRGPEHTGVGGGIRAVREPTARRPDRLVVTGGLPARYRAAAPRRASRRWLALDTAAIALVVGAAAWATGALPGPPGGAVLSRSEQRSAAPSPPIGAPAGEATDAPSGTLTSPSAPPPGEAPPTTAPVATAAPRTASPTRRPTATPAPTGSAAPTGTPAPTAAPTGTPVPSSTPTPTPEPSPSPTPTPEPSLSPTPTTDPTPTPTDTPTPTATPTQRPGPPGSPGPPGG
jgi:hypothetical protein